MTIYRGYDITKNEDDSYGLHSGGSRPPVAQTFQSEEAAMDFVDIERRKVRGASDRPVAQ